MEDLTAPPGSVVDNFNCDIFIYGAPAVVVGGVTFMTGVGAPIALAAGGVAGAGAYRVMHDYQNILTDEERQTEIKNYESLEKDARRSRANAHLAITLCASKENAAPKDNLRYSIASMEAQVKKAAYAWSKLNRGVVKELLAFAKHECVEDWASAEKLLEKAEKEPLTFAHGYHVSPPVREGGVCTRTFGRGSVCRSTQKVLFAPHQDPMGTREGEEGEGEGEGGGQLEGEMSGLGDFRLLRLAVIE
eukprot:Cvel_26262.t1-p1 / transcript=Cvel_26262.t1 / gene=Cvel_26262 / organism=Chromera_velia_CCMP2878 / gene_product=hypothetical protein / transcript_product=hypothetical protein / location=Cvel_scaffold3098:1-1513(-) / protein_length=246 / sequence_SO=supercontig / SO=protein_coding / is_pseudo=false